MEAQNERITVSRLGKDVNTLTLWLYTQCAIWDRAYLSNGLYQHVLFCISSHVSGEKKIFSNSIAEAQQRCECDS